MFINIIIYFDNNNNNNNKYGFLFQLIFGLPAAKMLILIVRFLYHVAEHTLMGNDAVDYYIYYYHTQPLFNSADI